MVPFTPEWWDRENAIQDKLKKSIVICNGCLKPIPESAASLAAMHRNLDLGPLSAVGTGSPVDRPLALESRAPTVAEHHPAD